MDWYNEPARWEASGDRLTVSVEGDTDFWRETLHGFVADDAHFYHRPVEGDFTATVRVEGDYGAQYDQAGLMVREDERVWTKCGVELLDGVQQASAVVTREFSDWSVSPLEDDPDAMWIRVERTGAAIEVSVSRDGEAWTLLRQAYLTDAETLQVGQLAAAPQGDGFDVVFEEFSVE